MPNTARSVSSGNGGSSGVPSTKCVSGTGIGVSRPGSASSAAGISVLWRKRKLMVVQSRLASWRYGSAMAAVAELELPEFDFLDTTLKGERFHATMAELAEQGWLAKAELGYFVLDRE